MNKQSLCLLNLILGSAFLNVKIISHQRHLTKCLEEGIADEKE